jgi:hypothetical protein
VKAGDAFFLTDRVVDTHLWVVISDPAKDAERVVLVSVTTYERYKESVCLLDLWCTEAPIISRLAAPSS